MTRSEIQSITDSVRVALNPDFAALHEKINDVVESVSAINERTNHMPTKDEVTRAIIDHVVACGSKRRWGLSILLALPATAASIVALVAAFGR